jgi:hypothetical protein
VIMSNYINVSFILWYGYIFCNYSLYYNKRLCFVFARGVDLNIALRGTFEQCSKTHGAYN